MTTLELLEYYAGLLILQYVGLARAAATIRATVKPILMPQRSQQAITFTPAPTSGQFKLAYGNEETAVLDWNDATIDVQNALRALTGFADILVTGSIAGGLTVDFVGVPAVVELLEVVDSTLMASSDVAEAAVTQTDQTLPIAVQNAFDPATAVGVQLDTLGKYQGVTRYGNNFLGQPIALTDSDFRILLQFAIIRNVAGSSLSVIQDLLHQFFPGQVFVFDYANMHMSYLVDSDIGSQDLMQMLLSQGLLPKPMGVQLTTTIYTPDLQFFGMLSAPVVVQYATQNSLSIDQAAEELLDIFNIWQFNSVADPITGQWLSAAQGV